jgi:membrane protein implicated in regulation of membrane protease activity
MFLVIIAVSFFIYSRRVGSRERKRKGRERRERGSKGKRGREEDKEREREGETYITSIRMMWCSSYRLAEYH